MTGAHLTRRQFLALSGSMAVGAALAACAAPTAAPGDAALAPGETIVDLVAWFTDRRTINLMTEEVAIPEFEASNPTIKIEMQFVPESEIQQKLLTAKAAGNAPDVSSIDETFLDTLTKQDVLLPIPDEVIDVRQEMGELTSFLYRLPHGVDDNRYYGLPNGVFSSALYYNADLLDELGYAPEDIPGRWDDFLVWAKEITRWDGDTLELAGMTFFANEYSMFEDLRYQIGGPLDGNVFQAKDNMALADDIGIQAWEFIMDLYHVHQLDSIDEGFISRDRFGSGRAVTLYNWTWFNGFMDTQYTEGEWGLVVPPSISGEPIYGRRGPDVGFTLTTQREEHMDASVRFFSYLISPAYLARYCKLRGVQPSLKSMWDDPEFSVDAGPHWGTIAYKNRPENTVDPGFWPNELVDITNRLTPSIRDEGEDIVTVLQREEANGNAFLQSNPQWSIVSKADYEANPQWLTVVG